MSNMTEHFRPELFDDSEFVPQKSKMATTAGQIVKVGPHFKIKKN